MSTNKGLEFADFLALVSLWLNVRNLTENEQQSDQQLKIIQQIDVGAANDRQAAYLLKELDRRFDEIENTLQAILKAVTK